MAPNPLIIAHREGGKNDRFLRDSFSKFLGNSEHPRGRILSIYRKYRPLIRKALGGNRFQVPIEVNMVLFEMRVEILAVAATAINESVQHGSQSAQAQAQAYQDAGEDFDVAMEQPDRTALLNGFMSAFDEQVEAIRALIASGSFDPARITGDESRLGILQPAPITVNGSEWIATALTSALLAWWIGRDRRPRRGFEKFSKQALSVIDNLTTETCLLVNGQIQPFNKPFVLRGTPRFADKKQFNPFHWRCRTSVSLYLPDFDFDITSEVERKSKEELERRKQENS